VLIDFHTHAFPDSIAQNAIPKLSQIAGGLQPHTDGTVSDLKRSMDEGGVDISVVLNIATNAHQQKSVNDFAAAINADPRIVAFGSVYPHADDAMDELDRIRELGLIGVKLHPDYQHFSVDDEKMKPLYRKISELGLLVLFHAGLDYGYPPPYGATPEKLARALNWLDTPVIAAHWGGLQCCEGVIQHLCGRDIYFDTAFSYGTMPKYFAQTILEKHGADRILFGTDTPWHTPNMEMKLLNSLRLTDSELSMITHENAEKLLKL